MHFFPHRRLFAHPHPRPYLPAPLTLQIPIFRNAHKLREYSLGVGSCVCGKSTDGRDLVMDMGFVVCRSHVSRPLCESVERRKSSTAYQFQPGR
jgi:hypothetical protein